MIAAAANVGLRSQDDTSFVCEESSLADFWGGKPLRWSGCLYLAQFSVFRGLHCMEELFSECFGTEVSGDYACGASVVV